MKEVGIEHLTELANWAVNVLEKVFTLIEKDKQGKKVTGWDSLKFVKPLFILISIIGDHKALGKEWLDLDDEEKDVLNRIVNEGFNIDSKVTEEITERLFYLLMEVGDFITDLAKVKQ